MMRSENQGDDLHGDARPHEIPWNSAEICMKFTLRRILPVAGAATDFSHPMLRR